MQVQAATEIGTKLLLRLVLLLILGYVLYLIRDIVLLVLLAALTSIALSPGIARLRRYGLSRTAAVIIIYTVIFFGGVALLAVFLPLFYAEIKSFLQTWPEYAARLDVFLSGIQTYFAQVGIVFDKEQVFASIESGTNAWVGNLFSATVDFFRGFIHFIGYFFLSLYLSLEEKGLEKLFLMLTPKEYHAQATSIASRIQGKISQWLFGQLILILIAFALYWIGLSLLGVPYALAIALFGGAMEILPYIGPILAAIPAIIVGLLVSPVLGISALIFYIVAHQIEAHIVAPQVMKRSAELNPVAFILAVLIGFELAGPLGIILSVPVAMILSVFADDILEKRHA